MLKLFFGRKYLLPSNRAQNGGFGGKGVWVLNFGFATPKGTSLRGIESLLTYLALMYVLASWLWVIVRTKK